MEKWSNEQNQYWYGQKSSGVDSDGRLDLEKCVGLKKTGHLLSGNGTVDRFTFSTSCLEASI